VTGSSPGKGGDSDFETIAYDAATGSELWAKRFDGAAGLDDSSGSLTVSPDGSSVFVPGLTFAATNDTDWVTLAYDASTGAKLWKREFDGPGTSLSQDGPSAISATPDGSAVFVTGESQGPSQGTDLKTIGYDATTGSKLWGSALTSDGQDNGFAVIVSPDSSAVFVTGYGYNNATGFVDALTVGYDAGTGAEIWAKHFNGPDHLGGSAYEISVSSDGASIFVTGSVQRQATVSDYVTISYDTADGSKLWSRLYDGPGNAVDGANDLTLTSDGATVIVTGRSEGSTTADYATVAYDSTTGATSWERRYDGPANDYDIASTIGASPDGLSVFVSGQSTNKQGNGDFVTVAYEVASGTKLWVKAYDGPAHGDDYNVSLSVAPQGARVFVTGASPGVGSDFDLATVAYDS
jgi:hypothetical protein